MKFSSTYWSSEEEVYKVPASSKGTKSVLLAGIVYVPGWTTPLSTTVITLFVSLVASIASLKSKYKLAPTLKVAASESAILGFKTFPSPDGSYVNDNVELSVECVESNALLIYHPFNS